MVERAAPRSGDGVKPCAALVVATVVAIGVAFLTWYVWYRLAGYSPASTVVAHVAGILVTIALLLAFRIRVDRLGSGARDVLWAILAGVLAYALVIGAAALWNLAADADLPLFRARYRLGAFVDNWILTAFGEELLYAGVVFTLTTRCLRAGRRWLAVPITALVFAGAHLPRYLAMDLPVAQVGGRLGLNLASWLVFGAIYLLSGNLWLVVIAHAATDYGLTPLITNEPLFGLPFMAVLVLAARWQARVIRRERRGEQEIGDRPPGRGLDRARWRGGPRRRGGSP